MRIAWLKGHGRAVVRRGGWLTPFGLLCVMLPCTLATVAEAADEPAEIALEAEAMEIEQGWAVIRGEQGYFPSHPGAWSGDRLRAEADDEPATASKTFAVERAGDYHLWVRSESAAGFDSLFTIEVHQNGRQLIEAEMGGREQAKYFPFGRGWRVHDLWHWHGTDQAYQKVRVRLDEGPARLILRKGRNGRPAAARVVDLFYLTDDLELQPGDDYPTTRSNILTRFNTTHFVKARVSSEATGPAMIHFEYYHWLTRRGAKSYYISDEGLTSPGRIARRLVPRNAPPEERRLGPGDETDWLPLELSTVWPARLLVRSDQPATLLISADPAGEGAVEFDISEQAWMDEARPVLQGRDIIVGTGQSRYEDRILQGRLAVSMNTYLAEMLESLEAIEVEGGRRARRLGLVGAFETVIDGFDFRKIAAAAGLTGQHYRLAPEVYHPDAADFGFNREQAYPSATINRFISGRDAEAFWTGDDSQLREHFHRRAQELHEAGLGHIPQNIKLLEETGSPPLSRLREWDLPNQQFREYLQEEGVAPQDVLGRNELLAALEQGVTQEQDLWKLVRLGEGTPAEAEALPVLYYHSVYFRAKRFVEMSAKATRIIEEETGSDTLVNSGSTYVNFGRAPLRGGIEPFIWKQGGGVSALFMGTSWGLGGTPEYLGPQTESYGAAVTRSLAKYHDLSRGCYLISDGNRGYTPEYLELAAYAMAAGRYDWWSYYYLQYPDGCGIIGYPELYGAIRRTSHTLGTVEDRLLASEVAPARIALGWSATTDIWDLAQPAPHPDAPGNGMYAMERHYVYMLLRHLQHPVDILGENDLTAGFLDDYDVYVLIGDHLHPDAAAALAAWVADGGTLVSVAGGGMRDAYGQPLATLKDVFGISEATLRKEARALRPKQELIHAKPLDMIRLNDGSRLPVYGYRQSFEVSDGRVLGRFRDGAAAIVASEHGDGRALIIGALPGIAYLSEAFPTVPYGRGGEDLSGYIFPDYNESVRERMAQLLEPLLDEPAVRVDVPEVEATVHRHRETGSLAIALVNFTGEPIEGLRVTLNPARLQGAQTVEAAFGSIARQAEENGRMVLTLDVDKLEYLHLD